MLQVGHSQLEPHLHLLSFLEDDMQQFEDNFSLKDGLADTFPDDGAAGSLADVVLTFCLD